MTRAISRDSFNELKQYLGVHLQQGRVILDSDWNEGQDIMANLARRLGGDAFGDGVLDEGFEIRPVTVAPVEDGVSELFYVQAGIPLLFRFPLASPFDAFESLDGWALSGPGKLRLSKDGPYEGTSFLRVSDHTGRVELARTLAASVDLSAFQFAHFRFRLNQTLPQPPPDTASFFIEDASGKRNVYRMTSLLNANGIWTPNVAMPLDPSFGIFDLELLPAVHNLAYRTTFVTVGATASVSWSASGTLPPGLTLAPLASNSKYAQLSGTPTQSGPFTFTITATTGTTSRSRTFTLRVQELAVGPASIDVADEVPVFWDSVQQRITLPGGGPADLAQIKKYGFQIFQQSPALIWDFDALYLGSRDMINQAAANNFIISGPQQGQIVDFVQDAGQALDIPLPDAGGLFHDRLPHVFDRQPRAYLGGLACTQTRDMLYSEQADPDDPPLTPPTGPVRKDLVYLDVWLEPVTYVEDPDLREIALGGPDTSTRMRLRQRIRVAQGGPLATDVGKLPTGSGMGTGTLATEGSYTDRANRLYLVEVDTAGDIGTATFRWSEDNASTIQRVIETVPAGTTKLKVEDASAFQVGDLILLRKEFKEEEHRISAISGNTILLQEPTAATVTFALADRPKIQRWNGFHVPIVPDPGDSTMSAAIALSHGVAVRFGGKAMRKGDRWTFRTRYLVGDGAAGISTVTRIETLNFELPHGVKHHYAPLAMLIRDPGAHDPIRVDVVSDRRKRSGRIVHHQGVIDADFTENFVGPDIPLGLTSTKSNFLCVFTGSIVAPQEAALALGVDFLDENGDRVFGQTVPIASTGNGDSMGIAVVGSFYDFTTGGDLVAARPVFTALPGFSVTIFGQLDIYEIKTQIRNLLQLVQGNSL